MNFDLFQVNICIYGTQRIRGDQHLPAWEPEAGVRDQIANGPVEVIEVEFNDLPYVSVQAVQPVTIQCFGIVKHLHVFHARRFRPLTFKANPAARLSGELLK
jgi:hypothetical protein